MDSEVERPKIAETHESKIDYTSLGRDEDILIE